MIESLTSTLTNIEIGLFITKRMYMISHVLHHIDSPYFYFVYLMRIVQMAVEDWVLEKKNI